MLLSAHVAEAPWQTIEYSEHHLIWYAICQSPWKVQAGNCAVDLLMIEAPAARLGSFRFRWNQEMPPRIKVVIPALC